MRILASLLAAAFLAACTTTPTPEPAAPASASAAPVAAVEPEQVVASRKIVQGFVDQNRFSGAVLVAKDGKPVFREGFGFANRELDVRATPDTVFRLASITKQFTAAAIMKLAEEQKLSIEDPVSKYYAASPPAWNKVTLRHLLSHRSGIADYTSLPDFFETLAANDRTPEEIIAMTRDMPVEFEAGTKFVYNNSGYVLLGLVIEKVSGMSYADYMASTFFRPLGMAHTGYDDTKTLLPNRADGYAIKDGAWRNAPYLSMTLPHAAGALYSTVDDLLIWEDAFFGDKAVAHYSREAMIVDRGGKYGFGLVIDDLGGHRNIWHNGGINGFSTHMNRFVDDGLTVVVLSNLESGASGRIATELSRLWLGVPPPAALVAVDVPPETLDRYVGVYELMPGMNITVTRAGATLSAQATGQSAFQLTATSSTEFHFEPSNIRMVFPAGEGPAPSFELTQGATYTARRLPN